MFFNWWGTNREHKHQLTKLPQGRGLRKDISNGLLMFCSSGIREEGTPVFIWCWGMFNLMLLWSQSQQLKRSNSNLLQLSGVPHAPILGVTISLLSACSTLYGSIQWEWWKRFAPSNIISYTRTSLKGDPTKIILRKHYFPKKPDAVVTSKSKSKGFAL